MQYHQLIDELKSRFAINCVSYISDKSDVRDITLIDGKQTEFQDDMVYCGYYSQLANADVYPTQCILACDGVYIEDRAECNISLVQANELFSVFNLARSIIEASRSSIYDELILKADTLRDLNQILNEASIKMGYSLIILDNYLKIICSSKTIPVIDPIWTESVKQGYCSYELVARIMQLDCIRLLLNSDDIINVSCDDSPNQKICANIISDGNQIGYLLMIANKHPLDCSHFIMMKSIVRAINYIVKKYARYLFSSTGSYERVLYQLLIGASPEDMQTELTNFSFSSCMAALCIRPTRNLEQKYIKEVVGPDLIKTFRKVHFVYHNDDIAAIIPLEQDIDLSTETYCALARFAENHNVRIGISYTFFQIEDFAQFYQQSQSALNLSHNFNMASFIASYREYQPYDLLTRVDDFMHLGYFCHPLLRLLQQYDLKNDTELYKTLKVYTENGGSIKEAASRLYVHRNTLVSRLARIKEIGNVDINEPYTILLLRMSYGIDEYISMKDSCTGTEPTIPLQKAPLSPHSLRTG